MAAGREGKHMSIPTSALQATRLGLLLFGAGQSGQDTALSLLCPAWDVAGDIPGSRMARTPDMECCRSSAPGRGLCCRWVLLPRVLVGFPLQKPPPGAFSIFCESPRSLKGCSAPCAFAQLRHSPTLDKSKQPTSAWAPSKPHMPVRASGSWTRAGWADIPQDTSSLCVLQVQSPRAAFPSSLCFALGYFPGKEAEHREASGGWEPQGSLSAGL